MIELEGCNPLAHSTDIYGSMYMEDGSTTVALTLAATYYPLQAGVSDGGSVGMTFQNNKELKCLTAGVYLCTLSASASNSVGDQTIACVAIVNTTAQQKTEGASRFKENGVLYNVAGTGIISLAVDDVVKFAFENETAAGSTVTVTHCNMTLLKLN
jgi:hypothetical protein